MNKELNVEGIIIKSSKLWWIKINTKIFRTFPIDGATFPYLIKIKYNIDDKTCIKNKLVYWPNNKININDKVIITYNKFNPNKILNISKKY